MAGREKTADDNIVICRCEDITLQEIRDLIAQGYHTIDDQEERSRACMACAR